MHITLNGAPRETSAATLAHLLEEAGYAGAVIATALNGSFVPAPERGARSLAEGDQIEVLAPMQGG